MEKNVKFENGVLTSTKTITESDVLEMFKEGKLNAIKLFDSKHPYSGDFTYKGNCINLSDITLDNVLDVYIYFDSSFEGYYEDEENNCISFLYHNKLLKGFVQSRGDLLENKDYDSLYEEILAFIDEMWFDCICDYDFREYIGINDYRESIYNSCKKYLSEDEYKYFSSYVEEDLILTYDPFMINSKKYAKELLHYIRLWEGPSYSFDNKLNVVVGEAALFKVGKNNDQDKATLDKFVDYVAKVKDKECFEKQVDVEDYDDNYIYYIFYLNIERETAILDYIVESLSDKVEITTYSFYL